MPEDFAGMTADEKVSAVRERYPLKRIKDIFTLRLFNSKFYSVLKFFLLNLQLEWNEKLPTMAAYKRGDYRVIGISPQFVADHCRHDDDIADCLFHEVMHHVFHHMDKDKQVTKNHDLANVAGDAIINAYLHTVGSSGFFEHFYEDVVCRDGRWGPFPFLRRNAEKFSVVTNGEAKPLSEVDRVQYRRFNAFYQKLYRLEVSLEEAVEFFAEFFPETSKEDTHHKGEDEGDEEGEEEEASSAGGGSAAGDKPSEDGSGSGNGAEESEGGGEGAGGEESKGGGERKKEGNGNGGGGEPSDENRGDGPSNRHEGGYDTPHDDFLDKETAEAVLHELGLKKLSKQVRNNFERIIRRIANASDRAGGNVRQGSYRSQRIPGKFGRRNVLRVGLGKRQFAHGQYKHESVALILDQSGSMDAYIEFGIKLVEWLLSIGKEVRVAVFADSIREFPAEELIKGRVPNVGYGTCGEVVAQFLQRERIPEAIIVTDNYAGTLTTPIKAKIYLALVEGSSHPNTFSPSQKVPRCAVYWLEPDKTVEY